MPNVKVSKMRSIILYEITIKNLSTKEYMIYVDSEKNEIIESSVIQYGGWFDIDKAEARAILNENHIHL